MVSIEYAAGFFDGEGCVNCSTNKSGSPFIRTLVVNTNTEILEMFKQRWGGDINANYKPKAHWKQAYTWRLSHNAAGVFLQDIQPFLVIKAKQCELALEFIAMRPSKGYKWTDDKIVDATEIINQIKLANKKGVALNGTK